MKKASIYCYAGLGVLIASCTIFAVFETRSILYIGSTIASLCFFYANEVYKKGINKTRKYFTLKYFP